MSLPFGPKAKALAFVLSGSIILVPKNDSPFKRAAVRSLRCRHPLLGGYAPLEDREMARVSTTGIPEVEWSMDGRHPSTGEMRLCLGAKDGRGRRHERAKGQSGKFQARWLHAWQMIRRHGSARFVRRDIWGSTRDRRVLMLRP